MANGMTRKDIRELLKNQDFLDQNLERFGVDKSAFPIGPAGALRRVFGGGLLGGPGRVGATSGTAVGRAATPRRGRRVIEGETLPVPRGALPAPRRNRLGDLLAAGAIGGTGLYHLLKDKEGPLVEAGEVPIVDPEEEIVRAKSTVIAPPGDAWAPPPGLQTGLDYLTNKRKFYIESISGALGQAAILNLMEKGAGDKFLEDIEGDVEQQEEFKDDEYIAKINKAVFSKPYKNSKQVFDRLVKAQIPIHIASQITGYIPKTKQATFINPETEETYTAPEDTTPKSGFRLVNPTLDKPFKDRTYETSEALAEAVRIGGLPGAEYLARYIYLKGGRGTEATYSDALVEAKEMMKIGEDKDVETIPASHTFATDEELAAAVAAGIVKPNQRVRVAGVIGWNR